MFSALDNDPFTDFLEGSAEVPAAAEEMEVVETAAPSPTKGKKAPAQQSIALPAVVARTPIGLGTLREHEGEYLFYFILFAIC